MRNLYCNIRFLFGRMSDQNTIVRVNTKVYGASFSDDVIWMHKTTMP